MSEKLGQQSTIASNRHGCIIGSLIGIAHLIREGFALSAPSHTLDQKEIMKKVIDTAQADLQQRNGNSAIGGF